MKSTRSDSMRTSLAGLLAVAAVALGCTVSENRYPLPLSAKDAPNAWGPIKQCATQRNLKIQDLSKDGRVNLWADAADTLEISYNVRDDRLYMDVVVWGEATDEDRKKLVEQLKTQGMEVWDCAQKIGFAPGAAPATP